MKKCGCDKMKEKEETKFNQIDERLKDNIKEMFYQIDGKKLSDEKLEKVKDSFIEMFVDMDRLKHLIIENTSNILMDTISSSPYLIKMIQERKNKNDDFLQ